VCVSFVFFTYVSGGEEGFFMHGDVVDVVCSSGQVLGRVKVPPGDVPGSTCTTTVNQIY
jgi:hypothetical protein